MRPAALVVTTLCLIGTQLAPPPLSAQEPERGEAWRQYQSEHKSEFAAAALEFFVPVLGHAYAKDAERGLRPLALSVAGLAAAILGTTVGCQDSFAGTCINSGSTGLVLLGVGAYAGGRIWGVVSALQTAQEYNEGLKQRLKLSLRPHRDGVEVGLALAWNP